MMNKLATLALAGSLISGCVGDKEAKETLQLRGIVASLTVDVQNQGYRAVIKVPRIFVDNLNSNPFHPKNASLDPQLFSRLPRDTALINLTLPYRDPTRSGHYNGPAQLEVGDLIDFTLTGGFKKIRKNTTEFADVYEIFLGIAPGKVNFYQKGESK